MTTVPDASRETARRIQHDRPGWMVIYGEYSRQYIAFPLFRTPRGSFLTARYAPALEARIDAAEKAARSYPWGTPDTPARAIAEEATARAGTSHTPTPGGSASTETRPGKTPVTTGNHAE